MLQIWLASLNQQNQVILVFQQVPGTLSCCCALTAAGIQYYLDLLLLLCAAADVFNTTAGRQVQAQARKHGVLELLWQDNCTLRNRVSGPRSCGPSAQYHTSSAIVSCRSSTIYMCQQHEVTQSAFTVAVLRWYLVSELWRAMMQT